MAFSTSKPIPLLKDQSQHYSHATSSTVQADNHPPASPKVLFSASDRRDKPGRGDGRPNIKSLGILDPYGIDIAPLNIFENQVIPIGRR